MCQAARVHIARWIAALGLVALTAGGVGCRKPASPHFGPRFFSGGGPVQCSKGIDRDHEWKHPMLAGSLERARDRGVVLHTFGHAPTIALEEYLAEFDWAAANGVPMVTFRELAAGYHGPGWAFTIDDDEVDTWYGWRELLRAHEVKVTFFVTRFDRFTAHQKQELHELAADGHDIEAHGVAHANAVEFVAAQGLERYLADEVRPSKTALAADGYTAVAFAYPYGAHTAEIDRALLAEFALLRTTGGPWCLE